MKSTQAMRDRIRELMSREQDDPWYARVEVCKNCGGSGWECY